jgi:Holliday junction resolvase
MHLSALYTRPLICYLLTNLRKDRGTNYENDIVQFINYLGYGFRGKRMSTASVDWPDVLGVSNKLDAIISVECKSSQHDNIYIPVEEVNRCFETIKFLENYRHKFVLFAFKFMSKTRRKKSQPYLKRHIKEFYLLLDTKAVERHIRDQSDERYYFSDLKCNYHSGIHYTMTWNDLEIIEKLDIIELQTKYDLKAAIFAFIARMNPKPVTWSHVSDGQKALPLK